MCSEWATSGRNTDDGNHLYRWNGTAWVDAQDGGIGAAAELAQAVQEVLNGLTVVDANGVTKLNGGRIDTDTLFAQDITATGSITGAQLIGAILSGNAIDIQAVIDATSIGLKTELVDNSYCLVLSAAGGTTKSSITLSRGSLKLVGQSLLELSTNELYINANTITDGNYSKGELQQFFRQCGVRRHRHGDEKVRCVLSQRRYYADRRRQRLGDPAG